MGKIEMLSSCLVRRATNGRRTTLELTPWDLRLLLIDPIQRGIIFQKPDEYESQQVIDQLKNSLSRALDFFPPLSGRLGTIQNDDNTVSFFINCNDAGAEFSHVVTPSLSVSDILEPKHVPEIVSSLFPLNDIANYHGTLNPLFAVQVTELADGFFIGCTANHAVVDGISFWHFLNSWAQISRGQDTIAKVPVFDRWFPSSYSSVRLPSLDQILWKKFVPPPLLERFFRFSKDSLAKLKAKANDEAGSSKISTLQALSAHLWRGVTRCRKLQNRGDNEQIHLILAVGARTRIPLPDAYFGNAVYGVRFTATEQQVLQHGLGFAAKKVNEFVLGMTRETTIKNVEDWLKAPVPVTMGTYNFLISSSPRHDVYGCDFGWGKPIAVRTGKGQKFDGKMSVFPTPEPGGIDVEVCLAPETLKALEDDEEFMAPVSI